MVQHVGNRHIVPGPRAYNIAIGTRGIDHMLANDVALIGDHFPFAGRQQLDVCHQRAAIDLRAHLAGTCCHRIGDIGGRNMAVGDRVESRLNTIGIQKRMNLLDLFRANNVSLIACEF